MKKKPQPLKGYGQLFRSGMTMKQKWAIDRRIASDYRLMNSKPLPMGKNE